jgi:hypothetical protein
MKMIVLATCLLWPIPAISQPQRKTIPQQVSETGTVKNFIIVCGSPSVPDIAALVDTAPLILRGNVISTQCQLSPNQMAIMTIAAVQVEQVLSSTIGRIPPVIRVQFGGGKMVFPNGTAEYVDDSYRRLPRVGDNYVAFLMVSRMDQTLFELARGTQGLFRVEAVKVVPDMPEHRTLYHAWLDKDIASLLSAINDQLRRKGR